MTYALGRGEQPGRRRAVALPHSRLLIALAVVALLAAACGDADTSSPGQDSSGRSAPITLTDQRGAVIRLDAPARRIVTIPMPAASMLIAIDGSPDRLAAIHAGSAAAIRKEMLGELFPKAATLPSDIATESFAPNVESITKVNPDLVVQWGDRGNEVIAPLENAGLKVLGLKYGSQEDLEAWIRLFGATIGKPDRAKTLLDWQHQAMDQVKAQASRVSGQRPKALYFNRLKSELRVAGTGTYNDFYINLVGAQNAPAEVKGFAPVNAEQVARWSPDIILVANFDPGTPADVYANPAWRDLSAVKAKRVYQVPIGGYRWDAPNQESPLTWRWLGELAHPEAFEFKLRDEMKTRYRFLYGTELVDPQIDRILRVDQNSAAAGYDRVARD